ncbi:MAG: hypothetical protein ABS81_29710 [Pseudonocardia sp. SCN 72-86]|nr:MAG: hypothetical protein ABS81_29710 [Pseudonocardia sp. SCN 72-86]
MFVPALSLSVATSASSLSAIGAIPARELSAHSAFSMRWKPVHWVGSVTSSMRASMAGSRSPKLSATGSMLS